jgi:hypothetical protein
MNFSYYINQYAPHLVATVNFITVVFCLFVFLKCRLVGFAVVAFGGVLSALLNLNSWTLQVSSSILTITQCIEATLNTVGVVLILISPVKSFDLKNNKPCH